MKRWHDKRNDLNLIVREKWKEINILKNKRDELNQSVKKIKKEEELILVQLDVKKSIYTDLTKGPNTSAYTTQQNDIELHKQIKDLDWKIQTNPLPRIEEERIISQIRHLEEQLIINRRLLKLKKGQDELFSTIKELSIQSNTIHRQKIDCVKKSQECHIKMFERIKDVNKIKAEADLAHNNFVKFDKAVNDSHNHYIGITQQIKSITIKIRKIEESTKQNDLDLIIEEQSKRAYEKMKQRKRLTLDEYILLKKKGLA